MTKLCYNFILVGCGKMGQAMLHGWSKNNSVNQCIVIDPTYVSNIADYPKNIKFIPNSKYIDEGFQPDFIVFAVKPQIMDNIIEQYQRFISDNTIFLSIAAGKTTTYLEEHLSPEAKIIRSMPNMPAAIGQGAIALYANPKISDTDTAKTLDILSVIGKVFEIQDESLIDAITALSGSGPAYVFLLIEAMTHAGKNIGLSPELSLELARQTVIGSASLASETSNFPVSELRENITSPGGTTEAALQVLMDENNGIFDLFDRALSAAKKRSQELST